ncbi:peroxiredoxin [Legionella worsleiensis]|uniref:thioredoxin-dependent peroxiredoxin n=1 Tax=Legionella worsleiensis TaxID=45076 RepID=A0A0W1AEQ9_9GAMM|nr:peroxiredoxin [Legionella worsleiensis]KTD79837.1 peroxiredoxin, AhpC/TSA family protein [Legionella worsleiensis]STY32348.1 peroxiredoxin, AhpC/TSA family protein [Legionella worsleiensis]
MRIGEEIPNFEFHATNQIHARLHDYKGQTVVLYFYPKDATPGCTNEGQDFSNAYSQFQALNTIVLGVSRDSLKSHENFKSKYNFPFELISDKDEELCLLFDVIKMKSMYGKQVRGIERSTFIIDKDSALRHEWRKVSVKGHVEEVLNYLKSC